jgi:hypothetical protein
MKILYNDSIKHGKNSTLEIKLECSYLVSDQTGKFVKCAAAIEICPFFARPDDEICAGN